MAPRVRGFYYQLCLQHNMVLRVATQMVLRVAVLHKSQLTYVMTVDMTLYALKPFKGHDIYDG